MCIDILALMIDQSPERQKTLFLIQKGLGIDSPMRYDEEILSCSSTSKETTLNRNVIERLHKGSLPYINEEGIVEFPQNITASVAIPSAYQSFKQEDVLDQQQQEPFQTAPSKQPSAMFLENKRKEEQKK